MMTRTLLLLSLVALLAACAATGSSSTTFPTISSDGLHLVPDSRARAFYLKPGADLSEYNKIALLEVYVAFAKNWQRDYNSSTDFLNQVSDKDVKEYVL